MQKILSEKIAIEKRPEPRRAKLINHRIEIKFVGNPIYQFRIVDVTSKGAGILIKDDSAFLNMIKMDQIVDVNFISPQGSNPSGSYSVKIKHKTSPNKQEHKGHLLVGISIVKILGKIKTQFPVCKKAAVPISYLQFWQSCDFGKLCAAF